MSGKDVPDNIIPGDKAVPGRKTESGKKLNILFLGGGKRVSVGRMLMDAAQRVTGTAPHLYSYELDPACPIASIATVIRGVRWVDISNRIDILCDVIDRYDIDIVIPFVDPAVEIAARLRDCRPSVFVPVGDAATAAAMFDKIEADRIFRNLGMPLPDLTDGCHVIAKPRRGSASQGILTFRPGETLPGYVTSGDYLLQRNILSREEITVDCYVSQQGDILAVSPRVRLAVSGGEVIDTLTVYSPAIDSLCRRLIEGIGLRGAVTIQFITDLDDPANPMVMEINPRLGGGVVASVRAGADIPSLIIGEALGREQSPQPARPGVRVVRYLEEVVVSEYLNIRG